MPETSESVFSANCK